MARKLHEARHLQLNGRFRLTAMEDSLNFEIPLQERARPVRRARPGRTGIAKAGRPELQTGDPIDIYHWAAVALVTALMCAVLAYGAGTATLARASNVTSVVFGVLGGALMFAGVVRNLRVRIARRTR
jgi:hypothetical protein